MGRKICILAILTLAFSRPAVAGTDQWVRVTSDHFTVVTDASVKEGRHILDQFERIRWVFTKLFPRLNVDPVVPITAIAVKNEKGLEALLPPDRVGKGLMQLNGLFMRSADRNYVLMRLDVAEEHAYATIYHEYTHLQFASAHQWLPIWLNEGMAEFMQNTEIVDKEVLLGEPSADNILYMRQHSLIPLAVLFKVDAGSPYYHEEQKGSVFYAESWALTHYLVMKGRETHSDNLDAYMHMVGGGEDPVAAAEKAFGDINLLEKALRNCIDRGDYKALKLSSAAAPIDESGFKSQVLAQTDADAARADLMAYDQRTDEARALIDTVLKQDPNNIQARETLGYLASRAGKIDEARKWYGEAIKLGAQDFLVYYDYASLSFGEDNGEVENDLRTAIKLNPRFAPAYDRLAAFLAMHREDLDEAHMLNLQATELEPDNIIYRINGANVLEQADRYNDAVNVLKAAARIARNDRETAMVQTALEQAEQSQQRRAEMAEVERQQQQAAADSGTQIVTVNQAGGGYCSQIPHSAWRRPATERKRRDPRREVQLPERD
jgi:tetratricopeptide (TPR) repeat protein